MNETLIYGQNSFPTSAQVPTYATIVERKSMSLKIANTLGNRLEAKSRCPVQNYCKMQLVACLRSLKVHASPSATKKHVIESCHALFLMCINCGKEHPARVCPHPLRKVAETFTWCSMNLPPNLSSLVLKNATIYSC